MSEKLGRSRCCRAKRPGRCFRASAKPPRRLAAMT